MVVSEKIIFLDVHGPMQSARVHFGETVIDDGHQQYDRLDPLSVDCLRRIVSRSGAKIVMNSTLNVNDEDFFYQLFKLNGYPEWADNIHRYWKTSMPDLPRDLAIANWLVNARNRGETISEHVVLDDCDMKLSNQVLVDFDVGLSVKNYQDAMKLLGCRDSFIIF